MRVFCARFGIARVVQKGARKQFERRAVTPAAVGTMARFRARVGCRNWLQLMRRLLQLVKRPDDWSVALWGRTA